MTPVAGKRVPNFCLLIGRFASGLSPLRQRTFEREGLPRKRASCSLKSPFSKPSPNRTGPALSISDTCNMDM